MAASKKTGRKTSSSKKTTNSSRSTSSKAAANNISNDKVLWSTLMFAGALLVLAFTLITGDSAWKAVHDFILGLFGLSVLCVPIVMIYASLMIARDKTGKQIEGKAVHCVICIIILSGAFRIFGLEPFEKGTHLSEIITTLYENGKDIRGGGLASIILGQPLMSIFGKIGSGIIIILLAFVWIMILANKTIVDVFRLFQAVVYAAADARGEYKPVEKPERKNRISAENFEESPGIKKQREIEETRPPRDFNIDIPLNKKTDKTEEPQKKLTEKELEQKRINEEADAIARRYALEEENRARAKQKTEEHKEKARNAKSSFSDALNNLDAIVKKAASNKTAARISEEAEQNRITKEKHDNYVKSINSINNASSEILEETEVKDSIPEKTQNETSVSDTQTAKTNEPTVIAEAPAVRTSTAADNVKTSAAESKPSDDDEIFVRPSISAAVQSRPAPTKPTPVQTAETPRANTPAVSVNTVHEATEGMKISGEEREIKQDTSRPPLKPLPPRSAVLHGKSSTLASNEITDEEELDMPETMTAQDIQREIIAEAKPVYEYHFPPIELLRENDSEDHTAGAEEEMKNNAEIIVSTLESFNVKTRIVDIHRGPTVTRFEIQPSAGVKISKITSLADDIALNLAAQGVRIEAPIPGKAAVGIEVPNKVKDAVTMRDIIGSQEFRNARSKLTFAVGKNIDGEIILGDISKLPHIIIAGTTGSGKSVCTNGIIMSILYNATPDEVRLVLIDPKVVEFKIYDGIPHLLIPVVTDPRKAAGALAWAVQEMLKRYKLFADSNVRDINGYNEMASETDGVEPLPRIVIIIDELADLMMAAKDEVEDSIIRLAQMARAAGMHLIIATQRPTVDVVTGLIKANIPSRIALKVSSGLDSRTILNEQGAEKLLGQGDLLYFPQGLAKPVRVQNCFTSDREVAAVVDYIKNGIGGDIEYDSSIMDEIESNIPAVKGEKPQDNGKSYDSGSDDDLIERAIECVVDNGQCSTSYLQRKLKLGYARAARIVDELEELGVVGPPDGSKPRAVLMTREMYLQRKLGGNYDYEGIGEE